MPSPYFSRFRIALGRSIAGEEGGLKESFIGKGKHFFGISKFTNSRTSSTRSDSHQFSQPGSDIGGRLYSQSTNRRKNLSAVGAISRTLSIPSVSGPSLQVCGYHIDCVRLCPSQFPIRSKHQNNLMAASASKIVFGEFRVDDLVASQGQRLLSNNSAYLRNGNRNRSIHQCHKVSMCLKNQEPPNTNAIYGFFTYEVGKRWYSSYAAGNSETRDFHSSSSTCFSAGTARDVSFDNSANEEQLAGSTDSPEKIISGKALKLVSGSCYLPHPDKEETGGEDAHFICADEQAIGVADGVGGWADLGVNAGLYSRELMSNSVTAIREEPKGSVDPFRVLEKAHLSTRAKGSSTACIIALTEKGVHAINLGDSGFMVVRDGCTVFRSPVQQHDFNFTYQLESGNDGDLPSSGQVFTVSVAPGDVIIAGTDGLFDNLYNNEITAVVVHAKRAGLGAQVTAQKIAALARQRAQDKDRQTPFSTAAQDAGFRYYGGKLDDITVVVSYVRSSGET